MPTFAWKSPKSLKKNLPGLRPGPADVPISGHAPRQPERLPPPRVPIVRTPVSKA